MNYDVKSYNALTYVYFGSHTIGFWILQTKYFLMIGSHWHDKILFHTLSYECLEDNVVFTDGVFNN